MEKGEVILKEKEYIVKINPGSHFNSLLSDIRALPGRKWDSVSRSWSIGINDFTTNKLQELGFKIPFKNRILTTTTKRRNLFLDGETYGARKYQVQGVQAVHDFNGRALIADEMGLGKTIEALLYLRLNPFVRPALIVCPATIKIKWFREVKKWCPDEENVYIIDGKSDSLPLDGVTIINYESLIRFAEVKEVKKNNKTKRFYKVDKYLNVGYKAVVFDEVHYIMNKGRQRTEISLKIAEKIEKVIGLSGTPFMSKPIEIFNFVNLLRPDIFPSRWRFAERFCNLSHNGFGWDFNGCDKSKTKELHDLLTSTVMIRRLKSEVLKELPPREYSVIPLELSNYKEYRQAECDILDNLGENKNSFLAQCEYLKSIAMQGKYDLIVKWIKDILESGEKLVIMGHHLEVIARLCEEFKGICVRLTGQESLNQKQQAVDLFQNDPKIKLFIGGLKAAGVGIDLTKASKLAMIEFLWTPGIHDQAGDRIHRYGQTLPVNIYYLVADNTIELDLAQMIDNKRKNTSAVLDGKEATEETLLMELYEKFKERSKEVKKSRVKK